MLRVCGITYAITMNYGSCMQAYALQTVIENTLISEEPCRFDLVPTERLPEFSNMSLLERLIKRLTRMPFALFERSYRKYARCRSISELSSLNETYDAFVCGSDVIWSPDFNKGLGMFYLDFAEKYAFAYAPSFGRTGLSSEYLADLPKRLSRLRQISVREPSAVKVIEENTPYTARAVLDPVLLLTREEWDKAAVSAKKEKQYIFVYVTHVSNDLKQFVSRLKEQTGLPVMWTTSGPRLAIQCKSFAYPPSPQRWLQRLRDAKYVVTNSFHATAFSTIYHKNFFTVVGGKKNGGINIRMNEFLTTMGLEDRIFDSVPEQIDLSEPSFMQADETLERLRAESLVYLRENLEAAYQEKLARTQA